MKIHGCYGKVVVAMVTMILETPNANTCEMGSIGIKCDRIINHNATLSYCILGLEICALFSGFHGNHFKNHKGL